MQPHIQEVVTLSTPNLLGNPPLVSQPTQKGIFSQATSLHFQHSLFAFFPNLSISIVSTPKNQLFQAPLFSSILQKVPIFIAFPIQY